MTYVRYATRARKHKVDLTIAQARALIDVNLVAVTILDVGTGSYTLTFVFPDESELELTQDEISTGDVFAWDIKKLLVTNSAQLGLFFKVIVDQQVT